jgi:hypothetical protein
MLLRQGQPSSCHPPQPAKGGESRSYTCTGWLQSWEVWKGCPWQCSQIHIWSQDSGREAKSNSRYCVSYHLHALFSLTRIPSFCMYLFTQISLRHISSTASIQSIYFILKTLNFISACQLGKQNFEIVSFSNLQHQMFTTSQLFLDKQKRVIRNRPLHLQFLGGKRNH